jgi:hypothetical protein
MGTSAVPLVLFNRNGQAEAGDKNSKFTHSKPARPSGDFGTQWPASSSARAHTTVRIDPTRVAIILLSGRTPMRTAISTWRILPGWPVSSLTASMAAVEDGRREHRMPKHRASRQFTRGLTPGVAQGGSAIVGDAHTSRDLTAASWVLASSSGVTSCASTTRRSSAVSQRS